ncbi:MAG: DNA repair protein RecO [Atopobiaceae bacterium]|jgi:DNA repair protein RecO (recombination protein O)|nr:DNA repair protein RecO [Olegusella sp.]MCI1934561.1 DNA repair protein RecO [Atopobiaceae bacterium]NLH92131.1 DNA repair protein RecO [Atopobium sp.]
MGSRRSFHTKAIVLGLTKLAEQDLILTMLSADGSQLRAVAKGARKPGSRFAARCDLFYEDDFLIARGRSLDIVTEASIVCAHVGLRGKLERVSAASAICELARLTSLEDATDAYLYAICSRALRACEQACDQAHLNLVVAAYAFKVLAHSGWKPQLDSCVACGDPAVEWFSPTSGGMLCASCARETAGAERLSSSETAQLRSLITNTFDELLCANIREGEANLLLTLAYRWATTQLDMRLKAFEFLLSL